MSPRHVNLVPKAMAKSNSPDLQKALVYGWIGGVTLVLLLTVMKVREASAKEDRLQSLSDSAKSMGASVQEITTRMKVSEESNKKFKETKEFLEARITWTEALKELSLLIPDTVWLTTLQTKTSNEKEHFLEITGEAPSQRKIAGFLDSLETSYFFRDVIMKKSEKMLEVSPDLYKFLFEVEVPQLAPKGKSDKPKAKSK